MENNLVKNVNTDSSLLYNQLLENIRVGAVLILNAKGIILNINSGVTTNFGYTPEDVVGKHFSMLFIPEDIQKKLPEKELNTVLETGTFKDNNYTLHKNQFYVWCIGESAYTEDEHGNVFIIKIIYDISSQKKLEKDLQEKLKEINRVNKDLDNFVHTASHDLKAPINNIDALVKSLYEELTPENRDKEEVKQILDMIDASIDKFKNTISDLTAIGRAEEENREDFLLVDFKKILEDVKVNLKELIQQNNPLFKEDFTKAPKINFSRKNLRSIIQNLVSNAIKYRDPSRRPEICVKTRKEDGYIVLSVSDNGLGIKPEDQEKVFSMYQRFHEHVEGTGVGMALTKRIIDNANGKIELESEPGKGSTFKIYFKL